MPSATQRHPPSHDDSQYEGEEDRPSEMLADDEDVAEELLDDDLGDEEDEDGIIGEFQPSLLRFRPLHSPPRPCVKSPFWQVAFSFPHFLSSSVAQFEPYRGTDKLSTFSSLYP